MFFEVLLRKSNGDLICCASPRRQWQIMSDLFLDAHRDFSDFKIAGIKQSLVSGIFPTFRKQESYDCQILPRIIKIIKNPPISPVGPHFGAVEQCPTARSKPKVGFLKFQGGRHQLLS